MTVPDQNSPPAPPVAQAMACVPPWLVLVGGFLGAGKTTLILAAAAELRRRGLRPAVITNDQGDALVDTALAAHHGLRHGEVTGGCFCCRLSKLVETIGGLRQFAPDVIFAEPVGSCTDLAATTLRPLGESDDHYRLAPLTVLVDPARAGEILRGEGDASVRFLFRKQLEEADLVCITKADLELPLPEFGLAAARQLSARTGQGVAAWLDEVLSGTLSCASSSLDIDYAEYARAEAALAWLNLRAELHAEPPISPALLLGPLLDQLDRELTAAGIAICHLKLIMESPAGFLKAAVCRNGDEPVVEGALDASPAARHQLLLNLRAVGAVEHVRAIVEDALEHEPAQVSNLAVSCFHPAAPRPERRMLS